jgi:glutathione synthase/RimK-type ligase-like ATP-grasp enzyme
MILIITSKEDLTADYLILKLQQKGLPFYRFNTEELPLNFSGSVFFHDCTFELIDTLGRRVNSKKIKGVWYRRPKPFNIPPTWESDVYNYVKEESWFFLNGIVVLANSANWISNPYNIRRAENKIYQLQVAQKLKFKIPKTYIGNSAESLKKFINQSGISDFIIKPIRSGKFTKEGELNFFHTTELPKKWKKSEINICPVIVQERIKKKRELRITVVGSQIFAVSLHMEKLSEEEKVDWRQAIELVDYEPVKISHNLKKKLIQILKFLGISFGAFDLIESTEGEYFFLEVNPNGQWAWIEEKTGLPIRDALIKNLLAPNANA